MSPVKSVRYPDLVIAESATESNSIPVYSGQSFFIKAPASLAGAVTVQVSLDDEETWADLEDEDGNAITLTADRVTPVRNFGAKDLRLSTTVAPGAGGETFQVAGQDPV